jgi:hypothetical protein
LASVIFKGIYGKHVVAEGNGVIKADRPWIGPWEIFEVVTHADGQVSFKSAHSKFMKADAEGNLKADATTISPSSLFTLYYNEDGTVSLKNNMTMMYMSAKSGGNCLIDHPSIEDEQRFEMISTNAMKVAYLSSKTNRFLVAELNGELNCNRKHLDTWEQFVLYTYGDGTIALKSHNNKHVKAKPNGRLHASAKWVQSWETFTPIDNGDGTVSLKSYHNKYVRAANEGGAYADSDSIGPSEKFQEIIVETM